VTQKNPPICDPKGQNPPSKAPAHPLATQTHHQTHQQHKTTILGPKIHHQTHLKEYEIFCGNEESLKTSPPHLSHPKIHHTKNQTPETAKLQSRNGK
jgi:hypothetical protein